MLLELALLLALVGCRAEPKNWTTSSFLTLKGNTFAWVARDSRVDFRSGGHVNYECLGSCRCPRRTIITLSPAKRFRGGGPGIPMTQVSSRFRETGPEQVYGRCQAHRLTYVRRRITKSSI